MDIFLVNIDLKRLSTFASLLPLNITVKIFFLSFTTCLVKIVSFYVSNSPLQPTLFVTYNPQTCVSFVFTIPFEVTFLPVNQFLWLFSISIWNVPTAIIFFFWEGSYWIKIVSPLKPVEIDAVYICLHADLNISLRYKSVLVFYPNFINCQIYNLFAHHLNINHHCSNYSNRVFNHNFQYQLGIKKFKKNKKIK